MLHDTVLAPCLCAESAAHVQECAWKLLRSAAISSAVQGASLPSLPDSVLYQAHLSSGAPVMKHVDTKLSVRKGNCILLEYARCRVLSAFFAALQQSCLTLHS